MFNIAQFDEHIIRKYAVEYPSGTFVFKQNDRGNTLYIIIEGKVQLSHKIQNSERLVAILGKGEILGEKAFLKRGQYRRSFNALTMTEATLLEIGPNELKTFEATIPDFMITILSSLIERLDKANVLISILTLPEPSERLIHYLLYMCEFFGSRMAQGTSFSVTNDLIAKTTNIDHKLVDKCIKNLLNEKIILKVPEGYILPDENALICYLPRLKERLAA